MGSSNEIYMIKILTVLEIDTMYGISQKIYKKTLIFGYRTVSKYKRS